VESEKYQMGAFGGRPEKRRGERKTNGWKGNSARPSRPTKPGSLKIMGWEERLWETATVPVPGWITAF